MFIANGREKKNLALGSKNERIGNVAQGGIAKATIDEFGLSENLVLVGIEVEHHRCCVALRFVFGQTNDSGDLTENLLRFSLVNQLIVVDIVHFERVAEFLTR